MTSKFADMESSSNLMDAVLFLLSSSDTGTSFMSISSLVLEVRQFSFLRDWPRIRKLEIPLSYFCAVSWAWGELRIPNLTRMSFIKCYRMLQIARVISFTISELLRENQLGGGWRWRKTPPSQIRVKRKKHLEKVINCTVYIKYKTQRTQDKKT